MNNTDYPVRDKIPVEKQMIIEISRPVRDEIQTSDCIIYQYDVPNGTITNL